MYFRHDMYKDGQHLSTSLQSPTLACLLFFFDDLRILLDRDSAPNDVHS